MTKFPSAPALGLSVALIAGCGTIKNLADTGGTVYGGVQRDIDDMDKLRVDRPCIEPGWLLPNINTDPCMAPLYPFDLLLSLTADTILLPYTGIRSFMHTRKQVNPEAPGTDDPER